MVDNITQEFHFDAMKRLTSDIEKKMRTEKMLFKYRYAQIHNKLRYIHTQVFAMRHDLINQNHHVYANM